jgi:hypothetical protein
MNMRLISALFTLLLLAMPAAAENRIVTLYLDGALVESEAVALKEYAEVSLPAAIHNGSLRIKPLDGSVIERVDIIPAKPDPGFLREMAKMIERREALSDRLKALDAREAIFMAAAKSQSSKVPRKSKNNPEPLAAVRQGTEFAIAQLECVYRARRITEIEFKSLEERLSVMKKHASRNVARVKLARKGGRIAVAYFRSDLKWLPAYDFRLNNSGQADVVMRAILPKLEKGAKVSIVPALLADVTNEMPLPVISENFPTVATFIFPVEEEKFSSAPVYSISFKFRNNSSKKLPAGEASCYLKEEYVGKIDFSGSLPGEAQELAVGK